MKRLPLIPSLLTALLLASCGQANLEKGVVVSPELHQKMEANVATPENLADFELVAPELTAQEEEDVALNERLERDSVFQAETYERAAPAAEDRVISPNTKNAVVLEFFQESKNVGKQFLLVRHNGNIRYVFAVSGGTPGRGTPGGTYSIDRQRWRHMSTSYPGGGENNMDHVSYFLPVYGFHSTTFGVYSKLGRKDSHGCVRLARPQARALFSLIKANGVSGKVISRKSGEPAASELSTIKKMLAKDLNLIQGMLKDKNKGDVPFTQAEYFQYRAGQMSKATVKAKMKSAGIKKIIEIDG